MWIYNMWQQDKTPTLNCLNSTKTDVTLRTFAAWKFWFNKATSQWQYQEHDALVQKYLATSIISGSKADLANWTKLAKNIVHFFRCYLVGKVSVERYPIRTLNKDKHSQTLGENMKNHSFVMRGNIHRVITWKTHRTNKIRLTSGGSRTFCLLPFCCWSPKSPMSPILVPH